MWERTGPYRLMWGKLERKKPIGKSWRRWEDNIKMDLQQVGWGGHRLDRSGWEQGQITGFCECGNEPSGSMVS